MKNPDEVLWSAGETYEYARQYLEQKGDIIRLEAAERTAKVTSALITAVVLGFIAVMVLIMLSIAAGFWLAQALDSAPQAFLIIAAIYALLGGLLFFLKRKIITNPALDFILDAFFKDENERIDQKNEYFHNTNYHEKEYPYAAGTPGGTVPPQNTI